MCKGRQTGQMTALKKYLKLETIGLWRPGAEAQRREVLVLFGDATLMLKDPKTERPLTHWSLPAIERLNPLSTPALYAPGFEEAGETLEIDDTEMIAALETVRSAIRREAPRRGALRGGLIAGGFGLLALAALVWLPGAIYRHAASVLPEATRQAIGAMVLADLPRVTGAPCADPIARDALEALGFRLFGAEGEGRLVVLRDGPAASLHLPGGGIALNADLIELQDSPEVAAGFALAEALRTEAEDPLLPVLRHAGLFATLGLLTSGKLDPKAVDGYAEAMMSAPPMAIDETTLVNRFAAAGVSTKPYALMLDPSGQTVQGLIAADPFAEKAPPLILIDSDWITLQAICAQ